MATTHKKKKEFTPEQRDAYHAEQREARATMLADAARELQTSAGWQRWIRCRAKINHYSANNLMLILMQLPTASQVAKYGDWQTLGRQVRKGEHALRIFAPMFRKPTPKEIAAGHPADKKILFRFRPVGVFDVSQTDGDELPEAPASEPITGDSHAHLLAPLEALATELGYSVESEPVSDMHGAGGYCDSRRKRIVVAEGTAPNAHVRVLVHEIAHALGINYSTHTREQAETLVECVTYIVCAGAGLDTGSESVPYVAGWAGDAAGLEAIRTFARELDAVARRIEAAVA